MPDAITTWGPVSWLHLSDRHTCSPRTGTDSHEVIDKLLEDLRNQQTKLRLRPDMLFFTGDLAFGHLGDVEGKNIDNQLSEGIQFLQRVCEAFDPPIDYENVFIVPGNHDVNRRLVTSALTSYLDTSASPEIINKMIEDAGVDWDDYERRLKNYHIAIANSPFAHLIADRNTARRSCYALTRVINGLSIGIAGFNTAWSCCREGERGKLWSAGTWQADQLLPALAKCQVRIALLHHPAGWFTDREGNDFWRDRIERRFHVALHGHEHDAWVRSLNYGKHVTISAGACYDRSDSKLNGYSFVKLKRLRNGDASGQVWLRRYDSKHGWTSEIITDETTNHGMWALPRIMIDKNQKLLTATIVGASSAALTAADYSEIADALAQRAGTTRLQH